MYKVQYNYIYIYDNDIPYYSSDIPQNNIENTQVNRHKWSGYIEYHYHCKYICNTFLFLFIIHLLCAPYDFSLFISS
jgi:hypothetical protein